MHIYQLGHNWKHPPHFSIERPNGHFGSQLILVRTKGRLVIGGTQYIAEPNTAFLIESCVPHSIFSDDYEYADDWIRFNIDSEDSDFIGSLDLRFNVPIKLSDNSISKLIDAAVDIFNSDVPKKNDTLILILKAVLTHLSEYGNPVRKSNTGFYDEKLTSIRHEIFDFPAKDWNIPDIADSIGISVSHFQRIYKKKFGVSCLNDVFMSRMQYAKQLLLNTEYSAKEIAFMCGYQNYEYFSRSFTRFACVSPAQYRTKFKEK